MSDIVKLVTELGSFGLLLGLAGWIIYDYIKNKNTNKNDIKSALEASLGDIRMSINNINTRVVGLEKTIIDMKSNPTVVVNNSQTTKSEHSKQFMDRLKLGPNIHKSLRNFCSRVNADHIFVGSFHNGNESITGIPYFKFDIIAERFAKNKVEDDIEFAFMYKDAELLRHDMLPSEVVQQGIVHYIIDENENSDLEDVDDIIYRRMVGRGIKQLAISLLHDPTGMPSGFVGCVRYDHEELDLHELQECGHELENIYALNEKLINNRNE
jgi:hypothetical protein